MSIMQFINNVGKILQQINVSSANTRVVVNNKNIIVDGKTVLENTEFSEITIKFDGNLHSLTAANAEINGDISGNVSGASITINGDVKGDIESSNVSIVGDINGNINATKVQVDGDVKGDVSAIRYGYKNKN